MFWMDASVRLKGSDLSAAYAKAVETNGFVIINNGSNNIFTVTHPNLYEYMPSNTERLKKTFIRASGLMLIYNTFETFNNYLLWYVCWGVRLFSYVEGYLVFSDMSEMK